MTGHRDALGEVAALLTATEPEDFRRSWQPVDLATVLEGSWEPPQPTVGRRGDGRGLFYPGKCHSVVSETEGGKTWFALAACLDEMRRDNHVVYLDFEDSEGGIVGRLLTMGTDRELIARQFHYLRPDAPLGTGVHRDDLAGVLAEHRPTLVALDGVTEAMNLHGLDPNGNNDAATFARVLPRFIAATGAAVVSLDHVTKSNDTRGRYALGAVHKLNGLDGAQYLLINRQPFGTGITGKSTVRIAKDRPGQLRTHGLPGKDGLFWYGDLVVESHGEGFAEVTVEPPHERPDDWRPTELMVKVAQLLADRGPLAKRVITSGVPGRNETVLKAVDLLILDGFVSSSTPHRLLNPYPEAP